MDPGSAAHHAAGAARRDARERADGAAPHPRHAECVLAAVQ